MARTGILAAVAAAAFAFWLPPASGTALAAGPPVLSTWQFVVYDFCSVPWLISGEGKTVSTPNAIVYTSVTTISTLDGSRSVVQYTAERMGVTNSGETVISGVSERIMVPGQGLLFAGVGRSVMDGPGWDRVGRWDGNSTAVICAYLRGD